jgi:hypothetical protein
MMQATHISNDARYWLKIVIHRVSNFKWKFCDHITKITQILMEISHVYTYFTYTFMNIIWTNQSLFIILILLFTILCLTPEHWGQWHLISLLDQCSKKFFSQNISVYKVVDCKGHRVWCWKTWLVQTININPLRASPTVLSMWLQKVQFIAKKSKCAGLAQEIGFFAPNSSSLPWLVKGATQLCTSKKECNK